MTYNDYRKETVLVASTTIQPIDDSRTIGKSVRAVIDAWFMEAHGVQGDIGLCCRIQVQTTPMLLERSAGRWEVSLPRGDEEDNLTCVAHWNRPPNASPGLGIGAPEEARAALYVAIDLARLWGLLPR